MASTRKCMTCNASGSIWGTPKLLEEGGIKSSKTDGLANIRGGTMGITGGIGPNSDAPSSSFGIQVTCWRCLGKGYVPEDTRDEGETNG